MKISTCLIVFYAVTVCMQSSSMYSSSGVSEPVIDVYEDLQKHLEVASFLKISDLYSEGETLFLALPFSWLHSDLNETNQDAKIIVTNPIRAKNLALKFVKNP